jgi:hypothetical protein
VTLKLPDPVGSKRRPTSRLCPPLKTIAAWYAFTSTKGALNPLSVTVAATAPSFFNVIFCSCGLPTKTV